MYVVGAGDAYVFKSPHQRYIHLRAIATATVLIKSRQREHKGIQFGAILPMDNAKWLCSDSLLLQTHLKNDTVFTLLRR